MTKPFKNRMSQEDEKTMRELKSTYIEMSNDCTTTQQTIDGLFALTIHPNCFVDEVQLENDFKFVLSLYYHWKYGSKWHRLKKLQQPFSGIIEQQSTQRNHIHLTIYNLNIEDVAIFVGYCKKQLKQLYPKASIKCKRIYDIDGWEDYTSPYHSHKDEHWLKKRIQAPLPINHKLFQQKCLKEI